MSENKALIVSATAGSGKTTTLIDGINYAVNGRLPTKYKPSDEQRMIWEWLDENVNKDSNIVFLAFNNAIATELKERLTHGEARTLHSLGCQIMRENGIKYKLDKYKVSNWYQEHLGIKKFNEMNKDQMETLDDLREVVKFCKDMVLTEDGITIDTLKELCILKQFEPTVAWPMLTTMICDVLREGSVLGRVGLLAKPILIDFDDMIYLPARHGLTTTFDVMLIDESQDLSHGKLVMLLNQHCNRYVFVGDPNQAIYGFAGADCNSFQAIRDSVDSYDDLPLTFTYRCGKAIVAEAQKIVGNAINAGPTNPAGLITYMPADKMELMEGDLLVSRVNAPLMAIAWKYVKQHRNVKVMGNDLGKKLVKLLKKICGRKVTTTVEAIPKIEAWRVATQDSMLTASESAMIAIDDQADCLVSICEGTDTIEDAITFVRDLFDDTNNRPMIRLSSIHRAKGLEADRVYFFNPANVPHKMAKGEEQLKQEINLKFVATTRAIHELIYVSV